MDNFAKTQIDTIQRHLSEAGVCLNRLNAIANEKQKACIFSTLEQLNLFEGVELFELRKGFENE